MRSSLPRTTILALGGLLVLLGSAAYWNSLRVPFLLDDTGSIVDNPSIRQLWPPHAVLSPPAHAGVGGRPVANLSFALNYAAGHFDVVGYHAVNVAIHVLCGLLLFGLARATWKIAFGHDAARVADASLAGFAIALLWLLHPLQTEAVTYVSQRTEQLMALFYLGTLVAFVRGAERHAPGWYVVAVMSCALGMATKEVMVTAPVVVFLYDRSFIAGSFRTAWSQRKVFYLALGATWCLLLLLLRGVHDRGVGYQTVTAGQYALTQCEAVTHYLRLAVWPAPLVFDYGLGVAHRAIDVWRQAALLVLLLAAAGWALWRAPKLGFLAAAVFILLAPTSSVVPVAGQPIAEHRMYLPLALITAGVALAVYRLAGRRGLIVALVICGGALGAATVTRNRDYRTAVTIWTDTVQKMPQNARAHAALGAAWLQQGDKRRAIVSLKRALRLDPRTADAHNNLATALLDSNQPQPALEHFEAALQLRPGVASTHYNYGNALFAVGRLPEAIAQQQRAVELQPHFPEARCALGQALAANGQAAAAIEAYEAALREQPNLTAAHFGLGNVLAQSNRIADAVAHFEIVVRAAPTSAEAHYDLATALALTGQVDAAIREYDLALKLNPNLEIARANLAALRSGRR